MRQVVLWVAALSASFVVARPAMTQQEEPQTHVITVTTFQVPGGEPRTAFWNVVDKYVVPFDKENPHVLSERLASHYWGDDTMTIWFITEYKDLAGIEQAEDWTSENFDKKYPEGSAERKTADEAFEKHFLSHFTGHQDNILSVDMKRAK
jgi:hypothetical protein